MERPLRRLVEELAEAWNRRDEAAFSRLFAENAEYVTGAGIRLAGRGRISDALFARGLPSIESGRISLMTESIRILGPDAAVVLCGWQTSPDDARRASESSARSGFVTVVAQRAGDAWHIVALQNTDRTP